MHYYTPKYRPPLVGTVPDGFTMVEAPQLSGWERSPFPRSRRYRYGVIAYPKPLAEAEMRRYELDYAEPEPGSVRNPRRSAMPEKRGRSNPRGETGWRSYGPGKFNSIVDSYVYALSLEGWGDEEVGDVQDFGNYVIIASDPKSSSVSSPGFLLDRDAVPRIAREEKDELTREEIRELEGVVGVIISENDQGLVSVDYFEFRNKLWKAWEEIKAEAEEFYEEQEEA